MFPAILWLGRRTWWAKRLELAKGGSRFLSLLLGQVVSLSPSEVSMRIGIPGETANHASEKSLKLAWHI